MRTLLLLTVLLGASLPVLAQTRQVSGVITDPEKNTPLAGVTIEGPGKAITQSGTDGRFTISVPQGKAILSFSYVGYETEAITVAAGTSDVAVTMEARSDAMGEVVVTALGIKRDKRSIGYSTS